MSPSPVLSTRTRALVILATCLVMVGAASYCATLQRASGKVNHTSLLMFAPVCDPAPIVTNSNDSGAGSLRDAIAKACDGGTITFDMGQVVSPVNVQSLPLTINKGLTINGPGASVLTISGNNQTRIFEVNVASPGPVTLSNLTIANGRELGNNGGGVLKSNTGTLAISNTSFVNNRAFESGGGIYNSGSGVVNLTNCTFNGNNTLTAGGGAIFNGAGGTLSITGRSEEHTSE